MVDGIKYMKRKNIFLKLSSLFLVVFLWGAPHHLSAQQYNGGSSSADTNCINLETIQSLIHISITDAYDILTEIGYQMGAYIEDTVYDTINYIPLAYHRNAFYDQTGTNSSVVIMESLDGLSNYVTYNRQPRGLCNMLAELGRQNFAYNKRRSTYLGSLPYEDRIERYEAELIQGENIYMSYKYIDEIEQFVQQKTKEVTDSIARTIAEAKELARQNQYEDALDLLDEIKGYYPPMDTILAECAIEIKNQRWSIYDSQLKEAVGQMDYTKALRICEEMSLIDTTDQELKHLKSLLLAQNANTSSSFAERCPQAFDIICNNVDSILNANIRTQLTEDYHDLQLDINIATNQTKESNVTVGYHVDDVNRRNEVEHKKFGDNLQHLLDSILNLNIVQPVLESNVFVKTEENISAHIRWKYRSFSINGDESRDSTLISSFLDTIETRYFTTRQLRRDMVAINENDLYYQQKRLPTKLIYTFGVVQKECNGETYTDVMLTNFETATLGSWLPSLLLPGLGTYRQYARNSVAARAIPFFFFAAAGTAGILWDNSIKANNIQTYEFGDLHAPNIMYFKNMGKYIALGGFAIAGTIYVVDIIEGIGNGFKNLSRSRNIRKALRRAPIQLQLQDISVRKTDKAVQVEQIEVQSPAETDRHSDEPSTQNNTKN